MGTDLFKMIHPISSAYIIYFPLVSQTTSIVGLEFNPSTPTIFQLFAVIDVIINVGTRCLQYVISPKKKSTYITVTRLKIMTLPASNNKHRTIRFE